jgi:hypothetical protein
MLKKLFSVTVLAVLAAGSLFVGGCASDQSPQSVDKPYSLTGSSDQNPARNPKYYDAKGHYRSEWVGQYR